MPDGHQLGDLQLAILRVLWARNSASATEVHAALYAERGLALSTIKTMLRKMDERKIVKHRLDGRTHIYRALIAEATVRGSMVGAVLRRMFDGNGAELVNHLIDAGDIDVSELDQLRAELRRKRGTA